MSALSAIALAGAFASLRALEPSPLPDEVKVEASALRYIETRQVETILRGRPWVPNRRLATLGKGTRLVVLGEVASRDPAGCNNKVWYAVAPFGFVCSQDVRASNKAPVVDEALNVGNGKRLPFTYAFVKEGGGPFYATLDEVRAGIVSRQLEKGMSLVVAKALNVDGVPFVQTAEGAFVPKANIHYAGQGSSWQGVWIEGRHRGLSFGWVNPASANVVADPSRPAEVVGSLQRRDRVPILAERSESGKRWLQVGEAAWVLSDHVNEVRLRDLPDGVDSLGRRQAGNTLWFDVDTGEQVMVAYRGRQPFFATLISSGRAVTTPLGNYPIWAKVASMTMGNQDYEDEAYMVQGVPWVLLFQGHNAFHGAYWHDRFGNRKSHGCVNLSPLDARFVFELSSLALPAGWTGFLPPDLSTSAVVHVRDSSRPPGKAFVQERPIGPPDPEEEKRKLEEAELRRAEQAALDETMAAQAPAVLGNTATAPVQLPRVPAPVPAQFPAAPPTAPIPR